VYDTLIRREFLHSIVQLVLTASVGRDVRGGLVATLLLGLSTFDMLLGGPLGDRKVVEDSERSGETVLDCSSSLLVVSHGVFVPLSWTLPTSS